MRYRHETRVRWVNEEEPPEGWVPLLSDYNCTEGVMYQMWAAPDHEPGRPIKWIRQRPITQVRTVSEWADA